MSQYLCVRKNEQELISFGRSSYVYQAFQLPYTEKWKELEQEDFSEALAKIQFKKEDYEEGIELHEKALEGLSYEDKLECLKNIKELKEELRDIIRAKHWIELLEMIANEYDENNKKQKMYYRIG